MPGTLLRPTFELIIDADPATVAERLRASLERNHAPLESRWARGGRHALLTVPRHQRRWWSPWLHLDVRAHDDGDGRGQGASAAVFGRFTPNPAIWTASMLALIALLAIALFALALALAQTTLDRQPWGWWVMIGAVLAGAGFVLGARVAQRRAGAQMDELQGAIEHAAAGAPSADA